MDKAKQQRLNEGTETGGTKDSGHLSVHETRLSVYELKIVSL